MEIDKVISTVHKLYAISSVSPNDANHESNHDHQIPYNNKHLGYGVYHEDSKISHGMVAGNTANSV